MNIFKRILTEIIVDISSFLIALVLSPLLVLLEFFDLRGSMLKKIFANVSKNEVKNGK